MRIVIAGGTGFVGKHLAKYFLEKGDDVIVLSRSLNETSEGITYVKWLGDNDRPAQKIQKADVFINLAGLSLNKGRWTKNHQKEIYRSRIMATKEIIRIMSQLEETPKVLINASAVGIYPASETASYTEDSKHFARDFLGRTVSHWEKAAAAAEQLHIRVAFMRFGVILGKKEGALPPIVLPYKLFAGGTVGSGRQWLSWVHIDDVIRAIDFTINNSQLHGPINITAPYPERMKTFGQTVAKRLNRPHWLPVPSFAMRLLLGKKSLLVLEGQKVLPEKLIAHHFKFSYETLDDALQNLLSKNE